MNPPDVGVVFRETIADLRLHLGRHLLASLPTAVVWAVCTSAIYTVGMRTIPPVHVAWFWMEDELVSVVVYLSLSLFVLPFVSTIIPYLPVYVGMLHAQRRWIDHGEPPGLTSALSHAAVLLIPASLTLAPMWLLETVVWWAGVLPAVVVEAALGFGGVAVVVHGLGPCQATHLSVRHFLHAPLWRLKFAAGLLAVTVVCGLTVVPMLLLPAFSANATIRAYRACYGTDPHPRPL